MKSYLGDGVYVDYDGYHIILTTENGITATNTIYLEWEVYQNLLKNINIMIELRKKELEKIK